MDHAWGGNVTGGSKVPPKLYRWEKPWQPWKQGEEAPAPRPYTPSLFASAQVEHLTGKEKLVLQILRSHQGKEQAITAKGIVQAIHKLAPRSFHCPRWTTRKVRAVISDLRMKGHLIGSSVQSPLGFYMINRREEMDETRAVLHSRAMKILAVDKALRKRWKEVMGEDLQPLLPGME